MGDSQSLLTAEVGQIGVVAGKPLGCPVWFAMSHEEQVHGRQPTYDGTVSRPALIEHLRNHALRTDGPFTLRSGATSAWYLDARQTTFTGEGAWLTGQAVLDVLDPRTAAVGGMTIGADPIAMATAMVAARSGRLLTAFSIRKEAKDHGAGGRLVGPLHPGTAVTILEDTTTTGSAAIEAARAASDDGLEVIQAVALVDRSGGMAANRFEDLAIPYIALLTPTDLGVDE